MNKQLKIDKANELLHTLVDLDYHNKIDKYQTKINRAAKLVSTLLHQNDILRWKNSVYRENNHKQLCQIRRLNNRIDDLEWELLQEQTRTKLQ
jgi:hypothetical protein